MQTKLLSRISEYLPLGLIVYDKEGSLIYANRVALNIFGLNVVEDIVGLNIFDDPNIKPEDKAKLRKGEDVSFETDYDFDRCREQFARAATVRTHKYLVTKVTVMRDEAGESQGFLLNCEDVTAKKIQEQDIADTYTQIRATQRELSLALNAGNLTSWHYQVDNQSLYKVGNNFDTYKIKFFESIRERVHPEDKERFDALLQDALHKRERAENNIVLRIFDPKNQNYHHYNFVYSVCENEEGKVVGITFIQRDITEDVMYQQNLIHAKNRAEEADKLKSTFLATMSHEIRTPLNAIVGFSQLLSETTTPKEKNEYKQLIEANSEILLKLIDDILDLSKIEAGSIDVNRQEVDLSQLCQELYLSFKQRIHNTHIKLHLINPYDKCIAKLDSHRFTQIFTNFVTNAIKYTAEGEIVMGYECLPGRVRFYVRDTGIGIPDDKKYRIFSRFEKLDDFAQGTGLGLSICKAIAEATGGKIGFESKEGEGSEFWYIGYTDIVCVQKAPVTESENLANVPEQESATLSTNIQNLHVLVAEDNDSNFLLMRNILKDNPLTRAMTGAEAVAAAKSQRFDVIFMDMKMPVMDGLEATSLIRKFDHKTPIISLTANAFYADKKAALAAGCNYFMTKPIKKSELIDLLTELWIIDANVKK